MSKQTESGPILIDLYTKEKKTLAREHQKDNTTLY